mgnify:FL=1
MRRTSSPEASSHPPIFFVDCILKTRVSTPTLKPPRASIILRRRAKSLELDASVSSENIENMSVAVSDAVVCDADETDALTRTTTAVEVLAAAGPVSALAAGAAAPLVVDAEEVLSK